LRTKAKNKEFRPLIERPAEPLFLAGNRGFAAAYAYKPREGVSQTLRSARGDQKLCLTSYMHTMTRG